MAYSISTSFKSMLPNLASPNYGHNFDAQAALPMSNSKHSGYNITTPSWICGLSKPEKIDGVNWVHPLVPNYSFSNNHGSVDSGCIWKVYGGCRKFLLLFGRIGPLALRPCALLRAWGFLPHSMNILQIPWWYGDMGWYGMSCARPCALLRGPAFLMPLYHALKILSPPKMWLKGRVFL